MPKQTVEKRILARIQGRVAGWAFTKTDFIREFGEASIRKALSSLAQAGTIRRVCQGVYDYPRHSETLGTTLAPDIDQVAQALARKFNWRIQATGDAALNLLGLSTQVPARWSYLTDGRSRQYDIAGQVLSFTVGALREAGFRNRESGLIVQAIKAQGRERIDQEFIEAMRRGLEPATRERALKDTRTVSAWIYEIIKQVCREED